MADAQGRRHGRQKVHPGADPPVPVRVLSQQSAVAVSLAAAAQEIYGKRRAAQAGQRSTRCETGRGEFRRDHLSRLPRRNTGGHSDRAAADLARRRPDLARICLFALSRVIIVGGVEAAERRLPVGHFGNGPRNPRLHPKQAATDGRLDRRRADVGQVQSGPLQPRAGRGDGGDDPTEGGDLPGGDELRQFPAARHNECLFVEDLRDGNQWQPNRPGPRWIGR
mmetsp:Transcript_20724/g.48768  ORF Transcript_20724/g.48768 Transcript_20724/m.48768 type:complete len:223 (-) Transcript_20724:1335-2003(-)